MKFFKFSSQLHMFPLITRSSKQFDQLRTFRLFIKRYNSSESRPSSFLISKESVEAYNQKKNERDTENHGGDRSDSNSREAALFGMKGVNKEFKTETEKKKKIKSLSKSKKEKTKITLTSN